MEEEIKKNLLRSGEYFMYSIWIQGQLSDLTILNRNKNIINDFVYNKEKISLIFKEERIKFWEKDFGEVKEAFENEFKDMLTDQVKADLDTIFYIRNAIAHSHVSIARPYLFYRAGKPKIEEKFRKSLDILNKDNSNLNTPSVFKLDFSNDEIYFHNFEALKRLDEDFLEKICSHLNVPHERIR